MVKELEYPLAGPIKFFGSALKFPDMSIREFTAAPILGSDTKDIMHGLG